VVDLVNPSKQNSMKQGLKRLTPNALRRIDDYLLRNYPTVWYAKGHWVLYAFILSIILFIAGYCVPNTFTKPLVHPIELIQITEEGYFLIPLGLALIVIIYWAYTQYILKFRKIEPLKVPTTLLIYGIGLFVILGLDITAFRMGTIVRTASLMSEEDLKYIEENNYFTYGFYTHKNIPIIEKGKYFANDTVFINICNAEDVILSKRYELRGWPDKSDQDYTSHMWYKSMYSKESELKHLIRVSNTPVRSYRLDRLKMLYKSNYDERHFNEALNLKITWSGRFENFENFLFELSDDHDFVEINDTYQTYYKKIIFPKIDLERLNSYGLDFSFGELKYGCLTFDMPKYVIPIEDGVRSVRHAQQYLNQKVILRYFKGLLYYLPFFVFLLYSVSFLSLRFTLRTLLLYSVIYAVLSLSYEYKLTCITDTRSLHDNWRIDSIWAEFFAFFSFLLILICFIMKKNTKFVVNFLMHLFLLAVIATALMPVFVENREMRYYHRDSNLYVFKTWLFYLTAALCLIAPVLFSYLKGLPKSR